MSNLSSSIKLSQRLDNKALVSSSRQMGWHGIVVEQYQNPPTPTEEDLPALSSHWLILPLGQPGRLIQKSNDRLHELTYHQGDSFLIPAGQPSYCRCEGAKASQAVHIHLQPELIGQVAEASEIDTGRLALVHRFSKQDLQLHQVAMLLLAESRSSGIMGRLYVESLSQALVIHLLRYYSEAAPIITFKNRSLTHTQLQQAIEYIRTYPDRDLSLTELARVVSISPTYFASLFKQAMGTSPHQYVIQQRVERAKVMLSKTDLAIADIALQVGFSSQSHLTHHFKRLTGMTPKQVR